MTSSTGLTRADLEAVFLPKQLISIGESDLARVSDPSARETLRTLGMVGFRNPVFSTSRSVRSGFKTLREILDWELTDSYEDVLAGADEWLMLGSMWSDLVALDPHAGGVYCLPEDGEIYLLNAELRKFIHFLYLMRKEQPNYDPEWGGIEEPEDDEDLPDLDHEGAHARTLAAMQAVDPAALENPDSCWNTAVLATILDPNAEHY